jgi:hypothetical protein
VRGRNSCTVALALLLKLQAHFLRTRAPFLDDDRDSKAAMGTYRVRRTRRGGTTVKRGVYMGISNRLQLCTCSVALCIWLEQNKCEIQVLDPFRENPERSSIGVKRHHIIELVEVRDGSFNSE